MSKKRFEVKSSIDLHIHTKYSDGNYLVKEILEQAEELRKKINLEVISITDHDEVLAYEELKKQEIRELYNGEIIHGTELSFNLSNRLYDVLGYNIDTDKMLKLLEGRANFNRKIEIQNLLLKDFMEVCNKKGIEYNNNLRVSTGNIHEAFNVVFNDISNFNLHPKNEEFKENIGKDNIAVFYKKYFSNPDSSFFVNEAQFSPSLEDAIGMIHKCNGKAFLAHSFAYGLNNTDEFIKYAINCKIDGIEKYYSTHTQEQENIIQKYADKYNLFISGGTDFHGEKTKPGIKIGVGKGNMNIPIETIKNW